MPTIIGGWLAADDQDGVRLAELLQPDAVQRRDDVDAEVAGEPLRLGSPPGPVHDDARRVVSAGGVPHRRDAVLARPHAVGSGAGGTRDAVPVQDDDARPGAG